MAVTATKCISFDISHRITSDGKTRKTVKTAKTDTEYKQYKADALRNKDDINNIVRYFLEKKLPYKATWIVLGINTGFRASDLLSLRVRDVTDDSMNILDGIVISEQKTQKSGKQRMVFFNEAVKLILKYHIDKYNMKPDSFIFENRSYNAKYLDEYIYDEYGNVVEISTTNEKYYYVNGIKHERQPAPVTEYRANFWIMDAAKELGIPGHYSTHCMRKTFAHFVGINWTDEYNTLAVQKALGHSFMETTTEHYLTVDDEQLKEKWLSLNLGLEVLKEYIK